MSGHAFCWAVEQYVRPAAAKFLLVMMAEGAGMDGSVNASDSAIEHLCEETSQTRQEVLEGIDRLKALGLIEEGKSVFEENAYKFIGMPPEYPEIHYIYKLVHRETGEFYIGVRSYHGSYYRTTNPQDEDRDYFGSGVWAKRQKKRQLEKHILGIYDSRRQAEMDESRHIREQRNSLCRNISNGYNHEQPA